MKLFGTLIGESEYEKNILKTFVRLHGQLILNTRRNES